MWMYEIIGNLIMGFRDSISIDWISNILFYCHPIHKKVNPQSYKMLKGLKNSLIQVLVMLIGLPSLFEWIGLPMISIGLKIIFLPLTYGWIFFYNDDLIASTRKVALWGAQTPLKSPFFKLNMKQKIQLFTSLSGQLKSIVFLILFYFPIYILASQILISIKYIGPVFLLISQSFFNSVFYYLKIWTYDKYNIGFIEKNWAYMIGYGFTVSFICNILLSGQIARGSYFLISQWMIINCVLHGPTQTSFNSLNEVIKQPPPNERINSYNIHRQKIRNQQKYRQQIVSKIRILKPAMMITDLMNDILAKISTQ